MGLVSDYLTEYLGVNVNDSIVNERDKREVFIIMFNKSLSIINCTDGVNPGLPHLSRGWI